MDLNCWLAGWYEGWEGGKREWNVHFGDKIFDMVEEVNICLPVECSPLKMDCQPLIVLKFRFNTLNRQEFENNLFFV